MKALPSGLRELCRKEVKRGEEPEGTDNSKETVQSRPSRTEALAELTETVEGPARGQA